LAPLPNYRQNRTDRTRAKNRKAQEKQARRDERRKSHQAEEEKPDASEKTGKEPE